MAESSREFNYRMAESSCEIRELCTSIINKLQEEIDASESLNLALPAPDEFLPSTEQIKAPYVNDEDSVGTPPMREVQRTPLKKEGNQMLVKMQPWSTMVLADASSMMTKIKEKIILMGSVNELQRRKEIFAVSQVWVSRTSFNPQPLPKSFDSRSPRERSGSSMVTRLWVFDIPVELPPPEPPDRAVVLSPPLRSPHSSACAKRNGLWRILTLPLRPPAKLSNCGRRAENEVMMDRGMHRVTAVTMEGWQRDTEVNWDGHQQNPFLKQLGQIQPNSGKSWASKKCEIVSRLLDMARKLHDMGDAWEVVTWNVMLSGYRVKQFEESQRLFMEMENKIVTPNSAFDGT